MKIEHKDVIITLENQEERNAVKCACLVALEICSNSIRQNCIANILFRNGVETFSQCNEIVHILNALDDEI